jgi:hypothetical protein
MKLQNIDLFPSEYAYPIVRLGDFRTDYSVATISIIFVHLM